jgi:Fur family ferric uptake transcriptional regulator
MSSCCKKRTENIKSLLKEAGFSLTKNKLNILELFLKSSKPLSSSDVSNSLSSIDESTIFRNLKQFTGKGILSEVDLGEGFKRYEFKPENHHHHHIICSDCGKIDILDKCDLSIFTKQLKKLGYRNINHRIEFFGECSDCA